MTHWKGGGRVEILMLKDGEYSKLFSVDKVNMDSFSWLNFDEHMKRGKEFAKRYERIDMDRALNESKSCRVQISPLQLHRFRLEQERFHREREAKLRQFVEWIRAQVGAVTSNLPATYVVPDCEIEAYQRGYEKGFLDGVNVEVPK